MTAIDHDLMKSLEYNGPYACRYTCDDCLCFAHESKTCAVKREFNGVEVVG